jgi:hypothetical protein
LSDLKGTILPDDVFEFLEVLSETGRSSHVWSIYCLSSGESLRLLNHTRTQIKEATMIAGRLIDKCAM